MSQENLEVARRFNKPATSKAEMLAALPSMVGLCDPEVEWSQRGGRETSRGREGSRRRSADGSKASMTTRPNGSSIAGVIRSWSSGSRWARGLSGAEVRSLNYELLTIRDGLIVRYREFYDESEALEAAGLSE